MANQTDSKVPEIRLTGFSGEWEEKPIGQILSETKRPIVLDDNQQYELVTVKRRNGGVVSRGHLWGREILVKNYSQLQTGDFLISKRQVVHGATGIVPAELNKAIVSNEYLVAVGNNKITTEFLTILASLPDMRKKFFLSSYGVDIEKLFFDVGDWKKRSITIPTPPEQTQIVGYFRELDSLIGLHQSKLDKLVTLKKTMLQTMFPKPGTTTPEVRFKGFSGEWVEKKLEELIDLSSGRDYKYLSPGCIPVYGTGGYMLSVDKALSNSDDAIGIGRKGTINKPYILKAPFWTVDTLFYAIPKDENQLNYVYCIFQRIDWRQKDESTGVPSLSKVAINGALVLSTSPLEQQKIGTYFRTMDELISKNTIQLQKLKQIKSACLEKMFV